MGGYDPRVIGFICRIMFYRVHVDSTSSSVCWFCMTSRLIVYIYVSIRYIYVFASFLEPGVSAQVPPTEFQRSTLQLTVWQVHGYRLVS